MVQGPTELQRQASALVTSYGSDVLATCIAMVRDRAAAEDLTQDVFRDAFRGLASFRGESQPRTWLLSIARNRCIDYLRERKREPWGGTQPGDPHEELDAVPDHAAVGSEWLAERSLVVRALDALDEGDRALVVLRFKNGLDYDELANAFGLRAGTVRMRVSRALARMREVLDNDAVVPIAREDALEGRRARRPAASPMPARGGAMPPSPAPAAAPARSMPSLASHLERYAPSPSLRASLDALIGALA